MAEHQIIGFKFSNDKFRALQLLTHLSYSSTSRWNRNNASPELPIVDGKWQRGSKQIESIVNVTYSECRRKNRGKGLC